MEKLIQFILFVVVLAVANAVTKPVSPSALASLQGTQRPGGTRSIVKRSPIPPSVLATLQGTQRPGGTRSIVKRSPIPPSVLGTLQGTQRPGGTRSIVKRSPISPEAVVATIRQSQDIQPDGNYAWEYETENGISAQEQGSVKSVGSEAVVAAAGNFAWTSPEKEQISISYIADENGYQPQGSHLPVAPPIPEAIIKSIAWNEAHPEPEQGGIKRIR